MEAAARVNMDGQKKCMINELLSYVSYYYPRASRNGIIAVLLTSFNVADLEKARDLLEVVCEPMKMKGYDKIPKKRAGGPKNTQEDLIIKDIMDIWQLIDEHEGPKDCIPEFVAVDMEKVPKAKPEELGSVVSIVNKLNNMEAKLKLLEKAADCQARVSEGLMTAATTTQDQARNFPSMAEVIRNKEQQRQGRQPTGQVLGAWGQHAESPETQLKQRFETDQRTQNNVDEDGFRKVLYRRPQRPYILGKKKHDTLTGGYEDQELFVFRVNKRMHDDCIRDYLDEHNIEVLDYELKSHPNARMKSFRVKINYKDYKTVMDSEFWPEDIACRRFRPKRDTEVDGPQLG
jgi:hypothetical protein